MRTTLAALREPRYLALTCVMIFVALACVAAGTWQIARFDQKVRENHALTANARAAAAPVQSVLPLVGGRPESANSFRLRTVTATGRYESAGQGLVRLRMLGGAQGFYVLTPLRTARATLLVVRGFLAQQADGSPPASVPAPPSGVVTVHARAEAGEAKHDRPDGTPSGQLTAINPVDQAARLRTRVYDGFVELKAGQAGTAGLRTLPPPSLSNPAGGAVEPQHFAYIIQWYLFAALALAAPVAMVRAERRERQEPAGDVPPEATSGRQAEIAAEQRRAAKLADRYGRRVS